MKIKITGTSCSISCLYAEQSADTCKCACNGLTHGFGVEKKIVKCTPSAHVACMTGEGKAEDCTCACDTKNHGVLKEIENFDNIKVTIYGE